MHQVKMLLSLPVELQQKIVDSVNPQDIVAFSLTCKQAHTICLKRLEEHKFLTNLVKEIPLCLAPANIRLPAAEESFFRSAGSPGLLVSIAEYPRLALLLKDLNFEEHPCSGARTIALEHAWELIGQLINASPILQNEDEVHCWLDAVTNGRGGAALGLLLSRLTQLKKIQFDVGFKDPVTPYVARAVSRLAARSQSGFLDQGLSQLTHARVEFVDDSGSDLPPDDDLSEDEEQQPQPESVVIPEDHLQQLTRLLVSLTRLPNLRHLSLMDYASRPETADSEEIIGWDDANDPDYPLPTGPSQLESLTVDRGIISAPALSRIIEHSTNFSSFRYIIFHVPEVFGRYWNNFPEVDPIPDMTLESICTALLNHAKSSLRRLHLEISDYGGMCGCRHDPCLKPYGGYMSINPCAPQTTNWRWHEFTNLERLTLDIDLFSNSKGGWLPFAETLPISIKEVAILAHRCPPGANKLDFENMFRGFKPQTFPNLRTINAWHRNMKDFHEIGRNGPEHILQIYSHMLWEADVPTDTVRPYELDDDYFKQKRKEQLDRERASGSVKMEMFGLKEDELYALPEKDLEGTVMFGVYYSVGMSLVASGKLYDNLYISLAVEKSWG
jgi:hypothetical protein